MRHRPTPRRVASTPTPHPLFLLLLLPPPHPHHPPTTWSAAAAELGTPPTHPLGNTTYTANILNTTLAYPMGPAVAGLPFSIAVTPQAIPGGWNATLGAAVEAGVGSDRVCGGASAITPDFGWFHGQHHGGDWIASFLPLPQGIAGRHLHICLRVGLNTPGGDAQHFISSRAEFIHTTLPSMSIRSDLPSELLRRLGGGDPATPALLLPASRPVEVDLRGDGGSHSTATPIHPEKTVVAALHLNGLEQDYAGLPSGVGWGRAEVGGPPRSPPCDSLVGVFSEEGGGGWHARAARLVHGLGSGGSNTSAVFEIPGDFLEAVQGFALDSRSRGGGPSEAYGMQRLCVCLSQDGGSTFTAVPHAFAVSAAGGMSQGGIFSFGESAYTIRVYPDALNSTVSRPEVRCLAPPVAGIPATCQLAFSGAASNRSGGAFGESGESATPAAAPLLHNISAADIEILSLLDGDGSHICPLPSLYAVGGGEGGGGGGVGVGSGSASGALLSLPPHIRSALISRGGAAPLLHTAGPYAPTLLFTFTPMRDGGGGGIVFLYRGLPMVVTGGSYGVPPTPHHLQNTSADPDPAFGALWGFEVQGGFVDSPVSTAELVVNGGGEVFLGVDAMQANGRPRPGSASSVAELGWMNETGGMWVGPHRTFDPPPRYGTSLLKPPGGGQSVISQSVAIPPGVAEIRHLRDELLRYRNAQRRVRVAWAFYPRLFRRGEPGHSASASSSASSPDVTVEVTYLDGGGAVLGATTQKVYHTSASGQGVSVAAMYGGVSTSTPVDFASPVWLRFSDEVVGPSGEGGVAEVRVVITSDTSRGACVLFDGFSVKAHFDPILSPASLSALEEIYRSAGGSSWVDSRNWLTGDPCRNQWAGVGCTLSEVTSISLPGNGLSGELPDLSALRWLKALDVSGNSLRGRVANLSSSVESLRASGNMLEGVSLWHDFDSGGESRADLDLRDGSVSADGGSAASCLVYADLSHNALEEIPEALFPDAVRSGGGGGGGGVVFTDGGARAIPVRLTPSRLEEVDLSFNRLGGGVPDLPVQLRVVSLAHNLLSGPLPGVANASVSRLGSPGHHALQRLDLSGNRLGGPIPEGYALLPQLSLLALQHNRLEGGVPPALGWVPHLGGLRVFLQANRLSGVLPAWAAKAAAVDVRGNGFTCPLPRAPPGVILGAEEADRLGMCNAGQG